MNTTYHVVNKPWVPLISGRVTVTIQKISHKGCVYIHAGATEPAADTKAAVFLEDRGESWPFNAVDMVETDIIWVRATHDNIEIATVRA